jgi:hypothetical protein
MEMKPFDLERAKAGDPICLRRTSSNITFVGVERSGDIVVQFDDGELEIAIQSDLRMTPKITTFYVNVYKAHDGLWCGTPETDIEEAKRNRKDDHGTESRNFYKVVSFEVEE